MKRNLTLAIVLISAMAGSIKAADTGQRAIKDETTANRDDGRIIKSETTISSDRTMVPPAQTADGSGIKFEKDVFTVLGQVRDSTREGNIGSSSRAMAEKVRFDRQTTKIMAPMQNLNQCRFQMLTDKAIAVDEYLKSRDELAMAKSQLPPASVKNGSDDLIPRSIISDRFGAQMAQVNQLEKRVIERRDKAVTLGGLVFDDKNGYRTQLKPGVDFMCIAPLRNSL